MNDYDALDYYPTDVKAYYVHYVEGLEATAAQRLELLRRANSFLSHHEDCVSHQDDNYCDCAIETIQDELAKALGPVPSRFQDRDLVDQGQELADE